MNSFLITTLVLLTDTQLDIRVLKAELGTEILVDLVKRKG